MAGQHRQFLTEFHSLFGTDGAFVYFLTVFEDGFMAAISFQNDDAKAKYLIKYRFDRYFIDLRECLNEASVYLPNMFHNVISVNNQTFIFFRITLLLLLLLVLVLLLLFLEFLLLLLVLLLL